MLKPLARRAARLVESGLERIGDRDDSEPVLEPYLGYATPEGVVLRGRVLSHLRRAIAGQPPVLFPARIPAPDADYMILSDIDDTMIQTGAHSLARNLWTTFTGSALTRQVHDDALALMTTLVDGGRNPVFYVSSSPWNLHDFLDRLFAREGVPKGPMFLRDLGLTDEGVGASHLTHKGAAIDTLLAVNPDLPAYLMGDSGQQDAIVYRDVIARHPDRIRGVALREPAPGVGADDMAAFAAIEAAGVPCFHAPSFDGALRYWGVE